MVGSLNNETSAWVVSQTWSQRHLVPAELVKIGWDHLYFNWACARVNSVTFWASEMCSLVMPAHLFPVIFPRGPHTSDLPSPYSWSHKYPEPLPFRRWVWDLFSCLLAQLHCKEGFPFLQTSVSQLSGFSVLGKTNLAQERMYIYITVYDCQFISLFH